MFTYIHVFKLIKQVEGYISLELISKLASFSVDGINSCNV